MVSALTLYDTFIASDADSEEAMDGYEEAMDEYEEPELQFGFEFELQLMLNFSSKMRQELNIAPENRFQTVYVEIGSGIGYPAMGQLARGEGYPLTQNIMLHPIKELPVIEHSHVKFGLTIDKKLFANHSHIHSDVGNIEVINTEPQPSIEKALQQINFAVNGVLQILWRELRNVCNFALFLPTITYRLGVLHETKHLNIGIPEGSAESFIDDSIRNLVQSTPHYFISAPPSRFSHAIEIKRGVYGDRVHIKLPYEFFDYETLLEGDEVHLPSIEYLKAGDTWGSPILLGYSENAGAPRYSKWRRKNLVV